MSGYDGISIEGNPQLIQRTLDALGDARAWLIQRGFPVPPIHVIMGPEGAGGTFMYFKGLAPDGAWLLYIPANDLLNPPSPWGYWSLIHEYGHCFAQQLFATGRVTTAQLYGAANAEQFADTFATVLAYPPGQPAGTGWPAVPAFTEASLLALWASPGIQPSLPPISASPTPTAPSGGIPGTPLFVEAGLFSLPKPLNGEFGAPRANGPHTGQDFSTPVGAPLPALFAGSVTDYELDTLGGIEARLRRPNGDLVLYAHCASVLADDAFAAGDLIAYSGNTGTATTGPHVHLEVRVNGVAVEPLAYCQREGAMGMTEQQLRELVRSEVEASYDLHDTIQAVKEALAKFAAAVRVFGAAI